jgi:hypothetical protein
MSNTPPIPDAMTPPWPAQPGPIDLPHAEETVAQVKTKGKGKARKAAETPAAKANVRKIAGLGAAIGIGSAAIVAALLYVNRPGKK